MDPATILTGAFAISKVVHSCSSSLFTFIEDVANADKTIRSLYSEVESLRRSLDSITKALESSSVKKHEKLHLWGDVNDCLTDCGRTVQDFNRRLEQIKRKDAGNSNVIKSAIEAFRLNFRVEEIITLRAQMLSYSCAMQTILQTITVHISSSSPDVILDELGPQLQTLLRLVTNLHNAALPPDAGSSALRRSRTRLERSAKEVASKASAVVSSRYVYSKFRLISQLE